nr:hypothetical protein [Schaalia odontolytica]
MQRFFREKLAQRTNKQRFSPVLGLQGELFRAPRQEREIRGELYRAQDAMTDQL